MAQEFPHPNDQPVSADPSLQPLFDMFSTLDFEEYGGLLLQSVTWEDADVTLDLSVHQQDQDDQQWLLRCREVRDSRICHHASFDDLRLETDHPLLLPYVSPVAELYFQGRPRDANAVVGQLLEAHHAVVGNWLDFTDFFNVGANGSLQRMLEVGFGKCAGGPQPLIDTYGEVLRRNGINCSSPPARAPMRWSGGQWVEETKPLWVLILGTSYFVTSKITAKRE